MDKKGQREYLKIGLFVVIIIGLIVVGNFVMGATYRRNGEIVFDMNGDTLKSDKDISGHCLMAEHNVTGQVANFENATIEQNLRARNIKTKCLMFRDVDEEGWTKCKTLDGNLICGVDEDGVC